MFLLLLMILVTGIVTYIVYFFVNYNESTNTDTKTFDATSSQSSLNEIPSEYETSLDCHNESYADTCEDTDVETVTISSAPRTFRDDYSKNYLYLKSSRDRGYVRCNIFASCYDDLESLDRSELVTGTIAYVKSLDTFYIYMNNETWKEYNKRNWLNLLEILDYSLVE